VSPHIRFLNSIYVDRPTFVWQTANWRTPDIRDLILYELSTYAFTASAADVTQANRGKFAGITERIESGYFNQLGINALSFMPLKDAGSPQGPCTLGYDPSFFMAPEPDLGTPDDLRRLIDAAHAKGISVVLDMVFNHTSNTVNRCGSRSWSTPTTSTMEPRVGCTSTRGARPGATGWPRTRPTSRTSASTPASCG
jgi:pullulanase/glycogen debranching enzyme